VTKKQKETRKELDPVFDAQGNRVCAMEGCTTRLSKYNDHIVCRAHTVEYAINYLPIEEPV